VFDRHYREGDMSQINREWQVIHDQSEVDANLPVKQVYIWLITRDNHIVVVSKDGENWQLPGGKPDPDDADLPTTAVREVFEETGLKIQDRANDITFFGQYCIKNTDPDSGEEPYLQVRTWLPLNVPSAELNLYTSGESQAQRAEDTVRFVRTVHLDNLCELIPWMKDSEEFKSLKRTKVIKVSPPGS